MRDDEPPPAPGPIAGRRRTAAVVGIGVVAILVVVLLLAARDRDGPRRLDAAGPGPTTDQSAPPSTPASVGNPDPGGTTTTGGSSPTTRGSGGSGPTAKPTGPTTTTTSRGPGATSPGPPASTTTAPPTTAAGGPPAPGPAPGPPVTLTAADAGRSVALARGQVLVVELLADGQGTWSGLSASDRSVLETVAAPRRTDGNAMATFTAVGPGQATVTAVQSPACGQATPPCLAPARLFEVTVVVR